MPWAPPETPSIQLGALKAYLDRVGLDCRACSAFFSILHEYKGPQFRQFFDDYEGYCEYLYMPLYLRRFGPPGVRGRRVTAELLRALRYPGARRITVPVLDGLEQATRKCLDRQVGPHLIRDGINVVGFSLNFPQVYASAYAAAHLRCQFPGRRIVFVYGGCIASLPPVYRLLAQLGLPGLVVIGEGERKLELLVRALERSRPRVPFSHAVRALADVAPGIAVIDDDMEAQMAQPADAAGQVARMKDLPAPDYDEYFASLRRACADEHAFTAFCRETPLLMEGSRGCFATCDFCGLNRMWHGFRARTAAEVMCNTTALSKRYGTSQVVFVDNVSDAWAAEYARTLVRAGIAQHFFMELRANHPEQFWTALSMAGLRSVQVGIESLSPPLLRAMGKATTVIDALRAHKYLSELGVWPTNHIITYHPASTLADIEETRRVLAHVPHWYPFRPITFLLEAGSRIYEGLSAEQRAELKCTRHFRLRRDLDRYALEYLFEVPDECSPARDVVRAWRAFTRQYEAALARYQDDQPRLDVTRVAPDVLRLADTRNNRVRSHELSGDAARIYDACHAGLRIDRIEEATGVRRDAIASQLAGFERERLVLHVDDYYLSVALRPRDELLRRYLAGDPAKA